MITQEENFASCVPEMQSMIAEMDSEIQLSRPLNVDWEAYIKLAELNFVKLLTIRDATTKSLLGFCSVFVSPNLHSKGETLAHISAIFAPKRYRKKGVGSMLLTLAEEKKRQYNWDEMIVASRKAHSLDMMLARRGWTVAETIHTKR